jgi:hypothetical protein
MLIVSVQKVSGVLYSFNIVLVASMSIQFFLSITPFCCGVYGTKNSCSQSTNHKDHWGATIGILGLGYPLHQKISPTKMRWTKPAKEKAQIEQGTWKTRH